MTDTGPKKTYTERLIDRFIETQKTKFTLDEVKNILKTVSDEAYEEKKANSDIIPFGKYKARKLVDVYNFDKKYLEWLLKQDFINNFEELKNNIKKMLNK